MSFQMKDFKNLNSLYDEQQKNAKEKDHYLKIVKKCYSIPKMTFILLAVVPSTIGLLIFAALGFDNTVTIKIMMVLITVSLILGTLSYIVSRAIYRRILQNIRNYIITKDGRLSLTPAILFQIIPVTLICLLASYFLISASELENKSKIYKVHYEEDIQSIFNNNTIKSTQDLINDLSKVNLLDEDDKIFIRDNFNTYYQFNPEESLAKIYYDPLLDASGANIVKNIYLLTDLNNIYVISNINDTISYENVTKLTQDKYTYNAPNSNEPYESISIEGVNNPIYKINNYAGISYSNLASNKQIDIYIEVEEKFLFAFNDKTNIHFEPTDSGNDFFFTYALEVAPEYNDRIYGYYGNETHGVVVKANNGKDTYTIIVQYDLSDKNSNTALLYLLIIFFLTSIVVYNFAASIKTNITLVSDGINHLANGKPEELNESLLVTSNDEIGDLVVGFNKVQNLTKDNIVEIKSNEQTLMEKERLASLGELIGGIAHNMKTPIMSTAGAAEGLTELITEYRASIDNPQVTAEDHKEIAADMLEWVTKIKSYNSYMSDIITAVKGQASQLASSESDTFTLYDLSKRVEILIKHEIKKALLVLNTQIKCDPSIVLNGDINSLIQVINNLISNSVYAYQGKPDQEINFIIDTDGENVIIQVEDFGMGMNEETKSKLFKQMYTTKGKNGTGLGLYMSYSTIRGKFNGSMTFESEEGKGTTFIITIPMKQK